MFRKSLAGLSRLLRQRAISSEELTKISLERLRKFNPALNCFITATPELALAQARAADQRLAAGNAGPLTGLPLAHKDIFCTDGVLTSCGSRILDNFIAPYDATVVEKLKAAGMVMVGKTNMDEFAMGSSSETGFHGPVVSPWGKDRVAGGSSGGSACAVAARIIPAATGTDTGGSIRLPAALCGITGLKPTYGLVSRYGMIAFASSLDQGGPIAQSAEDVALLLTTMSGHDPRDSTSVERAPQDYTAALGTGLAGVRIGLPKQYFDSKLDPAIAECIHNALKTLERGGAKLKEIDLPSTPLSIPAYYVVAPAEASSNLSRFDGVRFGHRCQDPEDLTDLYCRTRGEGFGAEVKRRIMIGTYVLSAGYYDAYYLQAQKIRRIIRDDFQAAFKEVDLIAAPTSPTTAFRLNERMSDPVSMYLSDIYTVSVNLAGLPAASIPAGEVDGLPVGMQLIGRHFDEARILSVAHAWQQQSDWHTRIPAGYGE